MVSIEQYCREKEPEWDDFVNKAKNGTFLFLRGYMDYHADRFQDCSFMFYVKGKLKAILPANRNDSTLYSHQGLTYGGLIFEGKTTAKEVCDLFEELVKHLKMIGIKKVVYKSIPSIYAQLPSEEPLYALTHVCKAEIVSRDISSVIHYGRQMSFTKLRKRGKKKACRFGIVVRKSDDLKTFWEILCSNLKYKYDAKPVHSFEEMELLKQRFPENIQLWAAFEKEEMIGGTLLYISKCVVKTQYISASPRGKEVCALDMLFDNLINSSPYSQAYFDMGTSAIGHSNELRLPLLFQKEGFGARAVCYDTYVWYM